MTSVATWYAGTTRKVQTTIKDTAGELVDLTGATAAFAMVNMLSSEVEVQKSSGDGVTFANSVATVTIDPADTVSLAPGDYQLQLEITLQDGTVFIAFDLVITLKANRT